MLRIKLVMLHFFIGASLSSGLAQENPALENKSSITLNKPQEDTLLIYFDHNDHTLSADHREQIKALANKLIDSYNKIASIQGYTDQTGSSAYNEHLSQKRASAVQKELLASGVPRNLIESIEGKGEVYRSASATERVPEDRVVQLILHTRNVQRIDLGNIQDLDLRKAEALIIENLNFQPGRHYLLKESIPTLKKLLSIMKEFPDLRIEIQGHICCEPGNEDGMDLDTKTRDLSLNRAKNIYEYLVRNGIESSRMEFSGFARTRPLYPKERDDYERKMNRRVEILILKD